MNSPDQITLAVVEIQRKILSERGKLKGSCAFSVTLSLMLLGWVYFLDSPSRYGMYHKVAVVPKGDVGHGLIVDVTKLRPIVGEVQNVFNFQIAIARIEEIYGLPGWWLILDHSKKTQ